MADTRFRLGWIVGRLRGEHSGNIRIGTFGDTVNFYSVVVSSVFQLMAPLLVSLLLAGVAAAVMQNEPRMVIDRIVPKLSKISIIKGWSRVFGKQGLVEFIKSLSKMLLDLYNYNYNVPNLDCQDF